MSSAIFGRWPDWKQYLAVPTALRKKGFCILVPAPNREVTRGLSISTDGRQVIIGFDDDHDHLSLAPKEKLPQFRSRVLARIDEILADKIFATSWRDSDDKLRVSICFRSPDNNDLGFIESGWKCRIRSWTGKCDRDYVESKL
jgi:hypothetical protein